ncbi:LacI family transcriptional regulator [Nocardiopsis kunsanensis]|uniref:LacI family transcriptional regulator n=1 Tax=Nocardiopsis kunsanensis TaxID=141693 RepID=A0A918XCV6_9ACTN|nr:LacI family transcriptional regulator [Nocardiopsis kunsanensis]
MTPEVRDKVRAAAEELSYAVSRNASGLVTGRTCRVAVVVPSLRPWYFASVVSGLGHALHEAGLDMLVHQVGHLEDWIHTLPLRHNSDALVAVALELTEEQCAHAADMAGPVVLVGERLPGRASVHIDDHAGTAGATRHLLNLGHARIAYIGSRTDGGMSLSSTARLNGYHEAMTEAGLEPWTVTKSPGPGCGELAVGELLSHQSPPTAVLAESDNVALGAHRALRRSGVPVPGAISLMGFDDHDVSSALDLTTVDQAPQTLGRVTGHLVADLVQGRRPSDTCVELPVQIVPRQSTAAPRKRRTSP